MSDLTKRLREESNNADYGQPGWLYRAAADEIDRLTAELLESRHALHAEMERDMRTIAALTAERDMLREGLRRVIDRYESEPGPDKEISRDMSRIAWEELYKG